MCPIARFHTARTLERFAAVTGLGPDLLGQSFAADEAAARLLEHGMKRWAMFCSTNGCWPASAMSSNQRSALPAECIPFARSPVCGTQEIECLLATARRFLAANVADEAGDGIRLHRRRVPRGRAIPQPGFGSIAVRVEHAAAAAPPFSCASKGMGARSTYWCPDCQKEQFQDRSKPQISRLRSG